MRRGARARGWVIRETEKKKEGSSGSAWGGREKEGERRDLTHQTTWTFVSNLPTTSSSFRSLSKPRR